VQRYELSFPPGVASRCSFRCGSGVHIRRVENILTWQKLSLRSDGGGSCGDYSTDGYVVNGFTDGGLSNVGH